VGDVDSCDLASRLFVPEGGAVRVRKLDEVNQR
jgi:hypothetical protein